LEGKFSLRMFNTSQEILANLFSSWLIWDPLCSLKYLVVTMLQFSGSITYSKQPLFTELVKA
jgi:hypothetical protein